MDGEHFPTLKLFTTAQRIQLQVKLIHSSRIGKPSMQAEALWVLISALQLDSLHQLMILPTVQQIMFHRLTEHLQTFVKKIGWSRATPQQQALQQHTGTLAFSIKGKYKDYSTPMIQEQRMIWFWLTRPTKLEPDLVPAHSQLVTPCTSMLIRM